MNEPIRKAIDLYASLGWDFNADLANCLLVGEVQCRADYFCMGWPVADGFFVRFLAGDMVACLAANRGRFEKIHFARELKHRKEPRAIPAETLEHHGRHVAMAVRNQRR